MSNTVKTQLLGQSEDGISEKRITEKAPASQYGGLSAGGFMPIIISKTKMAEEQTGSSPLETELSPTRVHGQTRSIVMQRISVTPKGASHEEMIDQFGDMPTH